MHYIGQTTVGIVVLLMLAVLVFVKRKSTGSVLGEKPEPDFWLWVVHLFNMLFLLVANPLAGLLLALGRFDTLDPTHVSVGEGPALMVLEIGGLLLYVLGYALMAWALLTLGRVYQVGGSTPRSGDKMVIAGPYRLVRHPMYLAALCISFGLAAVTQSLVYGAVFLLYLVLILLLVPAEEARLLATYADSYRAYQLKVRALLPLPRLGSGKGTLP